MSTEPSVVGIDVGTTGTKAVAITREGEVLARAERPYPVSTPHPGWSEQDPEDWWKASQECLEEVSGGREVAGIVADQGRIVRPADGELRHRALQQGLRRRQPGLRQGDVGAGDLADIEAGLGFFEMGRQNLHVLLPDDQFYCFDVPDSTWPYMNGDADLYLPNGVHRMIYQPGSTWEVCTIIADRATAAKLLEYLTQVVQISDKDHCPNGWGH